MKPETIIEIVKKSVEKYRASELLGRWRRMIDTALIEISKLFTYLPYICPFCGKEYLSWRWFKEHIELHLTNIVHHFDKKRHPDAPLLGYCVNCGKFVISPSSGVNYGSIKALRESGFTGDVDSTGLYCFDCMKKLGWYWGEKEKAEYR